MDTKYIKVKTYREGLPHIKLHKPLNTWRDQGGHVTNQNNSIFQIKMSMFTKLVYLQKEGPGLKVTRPHVGHLTN